MRLTIGIHALFDMCAAFTNAAVHRDPVARHHTVIGLQFQTRSYLHKNGKSWTQFPGKCVHTITSTNARLNFGMDQYLPARSGSQAIAECAERHTSQATSALFPLLLHKTDYTHHMTSIGYYLHEVGTGLEVADDQVQLRLARCK